MDNLCNIYNLIIFIIFILSVLDIYIKKTNAYGGVFLFIFSVLFLFSGLRFEVGMDYSSYRDLYDNSIYLNNEIKEPGFRYIFWLLRNWQIPFEIIVLLFAFLTNLFAFKFIKKYSPFPFFSLLFYVAIGQFYFNSFNAIRQVLAIYVILSSLQLITDRRFFKYSILIIFLSLFLHMTSIVWLPLYFLINRNYWWGAKLFGIIGLFFSTTLIITIISNSFYSMYLNFEHYSADVASTTYLLLVFSIIIGVCEYWFTYSRKQIILYNINYLALSTLLLMLLFENTPLIMVLGRLSYYFTPVLLVLLPIIISKTPLLKRDKFILIFIFSLFFFLIGAVSISQNGISNKLLPYKTIF